MKYTIDCTTHRIAVESSQGCREFSLYSPEALEILTELWVTVGWTARDSYQFTWAGRPIIQLPHDVLRYQELIWRLQPDVILETGVAHGGSLMLAASLCKAMDKGRVIGVDIAVRPESRLAIERHSLSGWITLIEGSSIDPGVVAQVKQKIAPEESVLVLLDSNHSKNHVAEELRAYAPLVTGGSYIIAADGIMRNLAGLPGARDDWDSNNPYEAVREFAAAHSEFQWEEPQPLFNESRGGSHPSYWAGGFLKRLPS